MVNTSERHHIETEFSSNLNGSFPKNHNLNPISTPNKNYFNTYMNQFHQPPSPHEVDFEKTNQHTSKISNPNVIQSSAYSKSANQSHKPRETKSNRKNVRTTRLTIASMTHIYSEQRSLDVNESNDTDPTSRSESEFLNIRTSLTFSVIKSTWSRFAKA